MKKNGNKYLIIPFGIGHNDPENDQINNLSKLYE